MYSLAHVGLVARVDADVELEVLARGQRLAAHVAQEVALARVRAQVAPQRVDVREVPPAHSAAQSQRAPRRLRVRARAVRQQVAAGRRQGQTTKPPAIDIVTWWLTQPTMCLVSKRYSRFLIVRILKKPIRT